MSVFIIVYAFQIGTILFEQDQQICIVAYKDALVSLRTSDRDRSNRRPRIISLQNTFYRVLLVACSCSSSKMKFGIRKRLAGGERKIANFDQFQQIARYRYFSHCSDFVYTYISCIRSRIVRRADFPTSLSARSSRNLMVRR